MKRTGFFWMSALLVLATACATPTPATTAVPPTATELPASATPTVQPTETPTPQPETPAPLTAEQLTIAQLEAVGVEPAQVLTAPSHPDLPDTFQTNFVIDRSAREREKQPVGEYSWNTTTYDMDDTENGIPRANWTAVDQLMRFYNAATGNAYTDIKTFAAEMRAGNIQPFTITLAGAQHTVDVTRGMSYVFTDEEQPIKFIQNGKVSHTYGFAVTPDGQVVVSGVKPAFSRVTTTNGQINLAGEAFFSTSECMAYATYAMERSHGTADLYGEAWGTFNVSTQGKAYAEWTTNPDTGKSWLSDAHFNGIGFRGEPPLIQLSDGEIESATPTPMPHMRM
jgi:hypothetical protein